MKLLFLVLLIVPCIVFAQSAPASAAPDWLNGALSFIQSIPKVGPIVSTVLLWIGAIGSFFTALTVFVRGVLMIPMVTAKFKKDQEWIDAIDKFSKKVTYVLDHFSILNAKKP